MLKKYENLLIWNFNFLINLKELYNMEGSWREKKKL